MTKKMKEIKDYIEKDIKLAHAQEEFSKLAGNELSTAYFSGAKFQAQVIYEKLFGEWFTEYDVRPTPSCCNGSD